MLEVARCFGALAEQGVRPKRTIVFASWDAEEFGILGSTEWVEELKLELQEKAIAYLNVDIAATGNRFYASAIPTLRQLVREATQEVIDPKTLKPVYENWKKRYNALEPRVGNLGSGSDHSPFVGHAGISAVSMGFDGPYGVYHAMQDNYYWMEHFGDPTFQYQVAMAQIWGIIALRLANADILPLDYEVYAKALLSELETFQNSVPIELERLHDLLTEWEQTATKLNAQLETYLLSGSKEKIANINRRLYQLERTLTDEAGLSLRPWFKHLVYAPGLNTGYAAVVFPGIRDAIEKGDVAKAEVEAKRLAEAFERMIKGLKQINALLYMIDTPEKN